MHIYTYIYAFDAILFITFICLCVELWMPRYTCGGQRTTFKNQFFPSTMWDPRMELRV